MTEPEGDDRDLMTNRYDLVCPAQYTMAYSSTNYEGILMANLTNVLQQLREERRQAESQIHKLDSAISVLQDLNGRTGSTPARVGARRGRVVSAAARQRMAAAQRARWARERQKTQTGSGNKQRRTPSPRRTLSAAARRRIAAAQKARWAKFRAQRAKKAA